MRTTVRRCKTFSILLLFRDADKIENITSRYENHEVGLETYRSLMDQFGGFEVNADRDPDTLFEIVESKLNKPLQTKFF